MKGLKRIIAVLLAVTLALTAYVPQHADAAKKKVRLNKKKVTLTVGKTVKLKVKNTKKKVKWSSNKKKIATVSKKGVVKAKKKGTAKITAKIGKKKYICKVTVKKKKTPTKSPGGSSDGSGTGGKVTGTPGKNITISSDKEVFTIGTRKLALGLTAKEVNTILGSLSSDSKRAEKSPQGFDVIAFRPSGKYQNYILIYLKDDTVVGICGIGKTMSYGDVKAGTPAATLESSSKWKAVSWFNAKSTTGAKAGNGAYQSTIGNATVLAYVDYHGDNTTYCIQAFNSKYSLDAMTKPAKENTYDSSILSAMQRETGELINAYLTFYGKRTFYINSKIASSAQGYADLIAKNKVSAPSSQKSDVVLENLEAANVSPMNWGEAVLYGSADAIGFANSMIESAKVSVTLQDADYQYAGLGMAACKMSDKYYTYLVMDYCDVLS